MENCFIDFIKIFCKSGDGGSGYVHFHRDRFIKRGGPDGGTGGKGGDIIFQGNSHIHTFLHLRYHKHWIAKSGLSGKKNNITGANGKDLLIEVPIGTVVKDEKKNIIMEITENFQKKILFKGGTGGKGNAFFRNSISQSPCYAQSGIKTKGNWVFLELKILSDVGFIGFPNTGKSTLLSTITNAKPKIGNFSFTTKKPHIGVVKVNFNSFLASDIPGIIEKASEGRGLGHSFLRHVERNSVLLFLISSDTKDKKKEYLTLLNELGRFNLNLLKKRHLLAISKSDLINNEEKQKIKDFFLKLEENIVFISSFTKEGIPELIEELWNLIRKKK
ncbi:GTPase ObgE [Blattabacterium cuenoti]|uniref:GTPase ObgE n=1 Tax=Blattabacterium cuenoti TaxID=1653831 RepID=UPI00163CA9BD|nr:GTPase ObgE [Blattabacterium cuenoti]